MVRGGAIFRHSPVLRKKDAPGALWSIGLMPQSSRVDIRGADSQDGLGQNSMIAGIRYRESPLSAPPPLQTVLWAIAIATMTGLATRDLEVTGMSAFWPLRASWGLRLVPVAAVCPAGLMAATAKWRRFSCNVIGCALILCIVTAIPILAKTHTASVPGVITDSSGRRVVDAAVTARNRSTNIEYRATSHCHGPPSTGMLKPGFSIGKGPT